MPPLRNRPYPWQAAVVALLLAALGFALAAVLLPRSAAAVDRAGLTAIERTRVQGIQHYLNRMTTVHTRFVQADSLGAYAEGWMWMARPGKVRIDYDPPVPILIVSDGSTLQYKDEELDQLSYVPTSSTPVALIIGEGVDFFGADLIIADFEQASGTSRITLVRSADPGEGSLTLVFGDKPTQLKKWVVVDAQGIVTTVSLLAPDFGGALDDKLFVVKSRTLKPRRD